MGLMLGKVEADTMIIHDSFALPVEGTETRVNASMQAYEYMSKYMSGIIIFVSCISYAAYLGFQPFETDLDHTGPYVFLIWSILVIYGWNARHIPYVFI